MIGSTTRLLVKTLSLLVLFIVSATTVVYAIKWELFETEGKMCYPVLITWFVNNAKRCKKACSHTPYIKFCQFNAARTRKCMMGRDCNKLIRKPGYKLTVWREANYKVNERCIKLGNGVGGCDCPRGKCEKPDINKWLGGKCGTALSHKQEVCQGNACDGRYAGGQLAGRFNWRQRKSPSHFPSGGRFAPQFWGPYVYDFPSLKLDENLEPTADNQNLPLLFGFNEPDRIPSTGGSVMPIDEAIKYWKLNVINGVKKGYKTFVSPAVTESLPSNYNKTLHGNYWLLRFLDRIASEPVYNNYHEINGKLHRVEIDWRNTIDYLAVHKPQGDWEDAHSPAVLKTFDDTVSAIKTILDEYNEKGFDIKGIWMTELTSVSSEKCKSRK